MNPRVKTVVPIADYRLNLIFSNGEERIYDCSHLLNFGVFQELQNLEYFKKVSVQYGTVVWPHEQDICPDTLYEDSVLNNDNLVQIEVAEENSSGSFSK